MSEHIEAVTTTDPKLIPKLNIYVCGTCHGHIVTVDRDDGTTPFMIQCKAGTGCKGMMTSSFYRVWDRTMRPGFEWYAPTALEIAVLKPHVKDHVAKGGLLLRPFSGEWDPPTMEEIMAAERE